mgnify:CR=1 FL=1
MLKNFWWPVEIASAVTHQPLPMTAVGQKFVLWRDGRGWGAYRTARPTRALGS